jgi:hypothetical protein
MKRLLPVFVFSVLLSSCHYDKEETLYGIVPCDTVNIKFNVQITQTIITNCIVCHGGTAQNGDNIKPGSYNDVLTQVKNGNLPGAVSHTPVIRPCPKAVQSCQSAKLKKSGYGSKMGRPIMNIKTQRYCHA